MKRRYLKMVRHTLRTLRHPHLRDRRWWRSLTKPVADRRLWIPCRRTVSNGMAIGMFFSMMTVLPLQMLPVLVLAIRTRANLPFALASCWLSNPLTTPALLWMQYLLGSWMRRALGFPMPDFLHQVAFDVPKVGNVNAASFLLGMMTTGVIAAVLAYPLVHAFSMFKPHHLPVRSARQILPKGVEKTKRNLYTSAKP